MSHSKAFASDLWVPFPRWNMTPTSFWAAALPATAAFLYHMRAFFGSASVPLP